MSQLKFIGIKNSAERIRFCDNLQRYGVLSAWIAIYIAFYFLSQSSFTTQPSRAQSVDRLGPLPPSSARNVLFDTSRMGETNAH